jgi:catalase
MAKSRRSNTTKKNPVGNRNTRATFSGPAAPEASPMSHDNLAAKAAGAQALASQIPVNALKLAEYDPEAHTAPPAGPAVTSADPIVGASTVTEMNGSEKVGSGEPIFGTNKTIGPLDRVRVDATKQALTTN